MQTKTNNKSTTAGKVWHILAICLSCLLLLLAFLCLFSALWYTRTFGNTGFDSVLFTLSAGFSGVQSGMLLSYLVGGALPALLCGGLMALLLHFPGNKAFCAKLFGKKVRLFPLRRDIAGLMSLVLSLGLIFISAIHVDMIDYLVKQFQNSSLYVKEYRDPEDTAITFPEEKRNLVYIILESMETSYLSTDQGGALQHNLIPELFQLAQTHTNFSHNDTVGGFSQISGASWTVGSMVAQTGGVPLITPIGVSDYQNGYGKNGEFLPGLTSLQNILHENGYYQALMVGSDARYGGRKTYYDTHDTDRIYDLFTARKDGLIPEDYSVWWGYEDLHLFEYAKTALTEISQQDQPFAFTMLTADTHHVGGYPCKLCKRTYKENYDNVISCSSRQVYAFVQWLMEQPFFENTTVVIVGDHESMDAGYFQRNVDPSYQRHMYNCFINAAVDTEHTKNRQFTAMDLFPTTLAALGCTIEGNRLGLGVNLYSNLPTLTERLGYDYLNEELGKRSSFYNRFYSGN
jgi:phosphoglycerol transferase